MNPKQVVQRIKQERIESVDCRFLDFPGTWQHCTYASSQITERSFEEGFGFDGSSVRGWDAINERDMLIVPASETAVRDPFFATPTLALICDVKDPVTRKTYSRDPRSIARKAEQLLRDSGVAETASFGPELEFFVFDRASFDQSMGSAHYELGSPEAVWGRGDRGPGNLGRAAPPHEGRFPCPPVDSLQDVRGAMCAALSAMGVAWESHHHEVATAGQCEIDLAHRDLLAMADGCMTARYAVRQSAAQHGLAATFMPKPLWEDNGSGMHTHFSLWRGAENLFAGRRYAGLSDLAMHAIGGLLAHGRALCAFTNPTTNSYKRLRPGYEAPTRFCYSSRNREAAIRVPVYNHRAESRRLELRCPDASVNPYLCFSALLMAALDGIENKMDPGDPLDRGFGELSAEQVGAIARAPRSLEEALEALEADHAFLTRGGVFSREVLEGWVRYKRQTEVEPIDRRPHPYEFCLYFNV
ncbi:MAG: type I glutamate--ammonia ligase [Planctomycetota bacterium]